MHGLFVTGTDTGIGKTTVSAALMWRYRDLGYWKPVQTGFPEDDDTRDVCALAACAERVYRAGVRLPRPLSPHLSARLAGTSIEMESLLDLAASLHQKRSWIAEGAGGVLVPLNGSDLMIDLIAALRLPALIVARAQLGTINHTLLTIEALRHRAIPIVGAVLAGEPNPENRSAIEMYGKIAVVGEMPRFAPLTRDALAGWAQSEFDRENRLRPYFEEPAF